MIPRFPYASLAAKDRISTGLPVVLTGGCPLAGAANSTDWNFSHLANVVSADFQADVYVSRTNRFMYSDDSKNRGGYEFTPPTRKITMTFGEFADSFVSDGVPVEEKKYLQSSVVAEMGPEMITEYSSKFNLEYALLYKVIGDWDALTTNLLLCGPQGAVTPLHFDEQQNMFAQLWGQKRVRLFAPDAFPRLYPFPMGHPCDRQSQVKLPATPGSLELETEEDRLRFPGFASLGAAEQHAEVYADLNPGDVLYVPQYWWHQMEALTDNTSLSWWYKDITKASRAVTVDGEGKHKVDEAVVNLVAVRRNVENLIASSLGPKNAHWFFLAVAAGMVDFPPDELEGGTESNADAETAWTPLVVDAAQREAVLPHFDPSWSEVLLQAYKMVRLLPFYSSHQKAKAFLRGLVQGRFNAVTLRAASDA